MEIFEAVLMLLTGLGVLLLGFKLLGDNMEKLAGGKLKAFFSKRSDKKLVGAGMGAASTAALQSAGTTTVMAMGSVGVGIISLTSAGAIIIGANVGTTLAVQIIALKSFNVPLYAMILAAIGAVMVLFFRKDRAVAIGYVLAGLGLLFVGLELMSFAAEAFAAAETVAAALTGMSNPLLLLIISITLAALLQSPGAVAGLVIILAAGGIVVGGAEPNSVLYIILGANIGACITPVISAFGANRNAKRVCLFSLLYNILSSLLFIILLLSWRGFMPSTFAAWFSSSPPTQIAMFHTFFCFSCTLLFLPFTKALVRLTEILLPDKKDEPVSTMTYMDKRFMRSPALAIGQLSKEIYRMADMAMDSLRLSFTGFKNCDLESIDKVMENNEQVQKLSREIVDYLINISALDVSLSDEKLINALHSNISDIVRIAELADNLTKYTRRAVSDNLIFSDTVYRQLTDLYELLRQQYDTAKRIVLDREYSLIRESDRKEDAIDKMRREIVNEHIDRLNKGECRPESNSVFINLVSNMERVGDHISYMAHSLDNV